MLISKTMFMSEVDCETCQWIPVELAVAGVWVRSMTKLRTLRKKLFWLMYHCAPPPPGMYGSTSAKEWVNEHSRGCRTRARYIPMTAIPAKPGAASNLGGVRASPMRTV